MELTESECWRTERFRTVCQSQAIGFGPNFLLKNRHNQATRSSNWSIDGSILKFLTARSDFNDLRKATPDEAVIRPTPPFSIFNHNTPFYCYSECVAAATAGRISSQPIHKDFAGGSMRWPVSSSFLVGGCNEDGQPTGGSLWVRRPRGTYGSLWKWDAGSMVPHSSPPPSPDLCETSPGLKV